MSSIIEWYQTFRSINILDLFLSLEYWILGTERCHFTTKEIQKDG